MTDDHRFTPREPGDVSALVEAQPLCWLVVRDGAELRSTTAPLIVRRRADGGVAELEGHLARRDPCLEALRSDPRALVLCLGPHSYVSPSWISDRAWAPTWNFARAAFKTEISLFDAPDAIAAHLRALVDMMEAGRPSAWSVDEMGSRFETLARGVVGVRARVSRTEARMKLGQDERAAVRAEIISGLSEDGAADLASWMRAFDAAEKT